VQAYVYEDTEKDQLVIVAMVPIQEDLRDLFWGSDDSLPFEVIDKYLDHRCKQVESFYKMHHSDLVEEI